MIVVFVARFSEETRYRDGSNLEFLCPAKMANRVCSTVQRRGASINGVLASARSMRSRSRKSERNAHRPLFRFSSIFTPSNELICEGGTADASAISVKKRLFSGADDQARISTGSLKNRRSQSSTRH